MLKRVRIILTVLLLLATVGVDAQVTTASMAGKVTDASNEPIIGATVQAVHQPSGSRYGTVTNVDGRYSIQGALKLFIRFALAKGAVTYGLELMLAVFSIVQGMVSTIITQSGSSGMSSVSLPQELIDAINNVGFWDSTSRMVMRMGNPASCSASPKAEASFSGSSKSSICVESTASAVSNCLVNSRSY